METLEKLETIRWMHQFDDYVTHAVTFTFKQTVIYGSGLLENTDNFYKEVTECSSARATGKANTDNFWYCFEKYKAYLNRTVLTPNAIKNGESIIIIPVLHGFDRPTKKSAMTRWHLHAAIGIGNATGVRNNGFTHEDLTTVINETWRKAPWTDNVTKVKPYRDTGWFDYMMKERSSNKRKICRSFIENSSIPLLLRSPGSHLSHR
jgi:hypothetical protein